MHLPLQEWTTRHLRNLSAVKILPTLRNLLKIGLNITQNHERE